MIVTVIGSPTPSGGANVTVSPAASLMPGPSSVAVGLPEESTVIETFIPVPLPVVDDCTTFA